MCFSKVTKSLGSREQNPLTLPGPGLAGSPIHSFSQIHQERSQCREARVVKSHPMKCLKAKVCATKLDRGLLSKGLISLFLVPLKFSEYPWLCWSGAISPGGGGAMIVWVVGTLWNYARFAFTFSILEHSCEKFLRLKIKKVFQGSFLNQDFKVQGMLRHEQ